jgi:hypothetical protein
MKSRTLFAAALILLAPLAVLAFQDQADKVRKDELKSRPFTAGPLKIRITDYYGGGIAFPTGEVSIVVENTSDDFTTFDPQRLSFVDNDNHQVDILGVKIYGGNKSWIAAAESKRIMPKKWIKNLYTLTDKLQLPLRLYYDDKLLGTIIY